MSQATQVDTTSRALTLADLNTMVNHEPRIAHQRLADALGYGAHHKMKHLVERHVEALQRFGEVSSMVDGTLKNKGNSSSGGRPGKTYWLNKKQALYLCTKSETANATEVTIQMVEVFDAYMKGEVAPAKAPAPSTRGAKDVAERLFVNSAQSRGYTLTFGVIKGAALITGPDGREVEFFYGRHSAYAMAASIIRRMEAQAAQAPRTPGLFEPGSDLLRDLHTIVMSAGVRLDRGQEKSFGQALESVLGDRLILREGGTTSGKTLLDWNWGRIEENRKRTAA